MKERFYILGIAVVLLLCGACKKDGGNNDPTLEIEVISKTLLDSGGDKTAIMVTSNTMWTVSVSEQWATPTVTTGKNNAKFDVAVSANDNPNDRQVTVTVKVSDELQKSVNITQNGKQTDMLEVSLVPDSQVSFEGGKVSVKVKTNAGWKVKTDDQWIEIGVASGINNAVFDISISPNENENDRLGTITVQTSTQKQELTVSQQGMGPFKMEQLYGTWWIKQGFAWWNRTWLTDPMADIGIRSLTIEKYNDTDILIRDLGAVNYYFAITGYNDYSLATVDEANRTIKLHSLVELDPILPEYYPETIFSYYLPAYDVNNVPSNAFLEFPEMAIRGVPGHYWIDMGYGQDIPLFTPPVNYKCAFVLGNMEEDDDGNMIYGGSFTIYCGTIISQEKPPMPEVEP